MLRSLRNRMKRDSEPRVLLLGLDNAGKTTVLNTLAVVEHAHKQHQQQQQQQEAEAQSHGGKENGADNGSVHAAAALLPAVLAPEGPTQGFNIMDVRRNGKCAKLCDLGGQRALREYWQDYYNNTDCILFVVDASDTRRMAEAHEAFDEVLHGLPQVPVLVLANKQDLATAKDAQTVAEALALQEHRERKWSIQGCSAKTGAGLEDGLAWVFATCCP